MKELSYKAIPSRNNHEKVAGLKSPFRVSEELQCYGGDESGLTSESERPSYRSVDDEEEDNASGLHQEPYQVTHRCFFHLLGIPICPHLKILLVSCEGERILLPLSSF